MLLRCGRRREGWSSRRRGRFGTWLGWRRLGRLRPVVSIGIPCVVSLPVIGREGREHYRISRAGMDGKRGEGGRRGRKGKSRFELAVLADERGDGLAQLFGEEF